MNSDWQLHEVYVRQHTRLIASMGGDQFAYLFSRNRPSRHTMRLLRSCENLVRQYKAHVKKEKRLQALSQERELWHQEHDVMAAARRVRHALAAAREEQLKGQSR